MASTHPDSLHPGARIFPWSERTQRKLSYGGVLRLALGAAAVLVLIALGSLDPRPTTSAPAAGPDPAPAAKFDGWGKWGGYAR